METKTTISDSEELRYWETAGSKPTGCRVECGGHQPPPPWGYPRARMIYRCGIAWAGNCPAVKSEARRRTKDRRHRLGLWRRSRRQHRLRAENMAVLLEFPGNTPRLPEGAAERIAGRAEAADWDESLYRQLRETMDLPDTLDAYLSAKVPGFIPK